SSFRLAGAFLRQAMRRRPDRAGARRGAVATGAPGRSAIYRSFGQRVGLLVGGLLLLEVGVEKTDHVIVAKFLGPGDERAITRNLVMLDSLRTADNRGTQHLGVVHFTGNLVGLLDKAVNCGTVDAPRGLTELREDLLQPSNLAFGFVQMTAKAGRELAIGRLLDQLRKCLYDLVLGVNDIPQRVQEKVVHGFDVFAEQAHFVSPISRMTK